MNISMRTVQASTLSNRSASTAMVPLSVPYLAGREWEYVRACLDTGWVSSVGSFVDRFEREVAAYTGAAYAVATTNGTVALHVALQAVGVQADDEVLVPDLTFIAPVNAVRYCHAHPVLVDADALTWQLDVEKLRTFLSSECDVRGQMCVDRLTGRRVRAIVPVHLLGSTCAMDQILELARRYHLRVVEDAAEAMGARYQGRHAGTLGEAGVLSFNGNKIMTAGGGGMVLTNDAALARYIEYLTTQAKDDELEYIHEEVGYNYRLSNLQAALGVAQLEQLGGFIEKKRAIAEVYAHAFGACEELTLMSIPPGVEPTHWLSTVLLPQGTVRARRQALVAHLRELGFEARPLWHPMHGLTPYRDARHTPLTVSSHLYERAVSLPSSVGMSVDDAQRCAAVVIAWLRDAS